MECHACKKPLEVFDSVWMLTTGMYKSEQAETPGWYFNPIRAWHAEHAEKLSLESPLVGVECSICGGEFGRVERVTFQVSGSIPESGYIGLESRTIRFMAHTSCFDEKYPNCSN